MIASEPFVAMVKPVGPRCNLDCSYCYYRKTGSGSDGRETFRMTDQRLEALIRDTIRSSPGPVVSFVWHGGEPTLAGLDFFRRAVELQGRHLPTGWSCWNNLQTNGILLDDAWCEFLAEAHFDVGVSLDGTERLHDAIRRDLRGGTTHARVLSAIDRLQSHGIRPDLLCTVTSEIAKDPLAVYRALSGLGTGWIQFIPIVRRTADGRPTADSVSGAAYGEFLCRVFDAWTRRGLGTLDVQLFAELRLVLSGGTASVCWMAPTCGRVLVVEKDGDVYSCDHFVDAAHRIGHLGTTTPGALVESPVQRRFGLDKRDLLPRACLECPWLRLCNGGCPKDRLDRTAGGGNGLDVLCEGMKKFFAHSVPVLEEIVRLRKSGASDATIQTAMSERAAAAWKGVGRNDPCPCGSGRKSKQCCGSDRPGAV